jgi:hypothetical protein
MSLPIDSPVNLQRDQPAVNIRFTGDAEALAEADLVLDAPVTLL